MKQGLKTDKLGLAMEENSQKIPSPLGDVIEPSFDSLLAAEIRFVAEGKKIPADPFYIVQRYIGANIAFCGVNNLALANRETGKALSHRNSAGELDVISPDEEFLDGKSKAENCG